MPSKLLPFASLLLMLLTVGLHATPAAQEDWADSTLKAMSLEEKIGQLFMLAAYSNKGKAHQEEIQSLIEEYHIGGLIFMQGGPYRQARLTNQYQARSKIPLMIAMDAEWGLSMRLDSTLSYPKQMTLGALEDNRLIYQMGTPNRRAMP